MKTFFTLLLLVLFGVANAQDKIYVHTATAENSSNNLTIIDHPDLNGNPNAGLVYVHNWNPGGTASMYNNNVTGLFYNGLRWTIFNEDLNVDIVEGSHYNIYIADDSNVITHVATAASQGFLPSDTLIDHPLLNGNFPGRYAVFSHYFNPDNVYNNYNYGFFYDTTSNKRGIYQEGAVPIPENAGFKILIAGFEATTIEHQTATDNITDNFTVINHSALNNNPDATFVFSHYWAVLVQAVK